MSPLGRSVSTQSAILSREDIARADAFCERHNTAVLTIVFTDVVGSVRLKADLGEDAGIVLIQRHFQEIRDILRQFPKGEEIKTTGDGFLIIFALPSKAVEFALAVQRRMYQIRPELPRAVLVRIGIHLGEVVREDRVGGDIFGLQVDKAVRVRDLAESDEILMTQAVYENARPILAGADLPPLVWNNQGLQSVKGLDEPASIYSVGYAALMGASAKEMRQPEAVIKRGVAPRRLVTRWAIAAGFILGMIAFSVFGWTIGRMTYVDPKSAEDLAVALAPFTVADARDEIGQTMAANLRANVRARLESLAIGSKLRLMDLTASPANEKEAVRLAKRENAHLILWGQLYIVRAAKGETPAVRQLRLVAIEGRSLQRVLPEERVRAAVAEIVNRPSKIDAEGSDLTELSRGAAASVEIVLAASLYQKGDRQAAAQLVETMPDVRAAGMRGLLEPPTQPFRPDFPDY
jgi:class 3 adenylate cyclase